MNRVTRMGVGLIALIPVLWFGGWLLAAIGVEGEAAAWIVFGVAAVWMAVTTWWALRAPAPTQLSDEARRRYFAFLRHGRYRAFEDETKNTEVGHQR